MGSIVVTSFRGNIRGASGRLQARCKCSRGDTLMRGPSF